MAVISGMPYAVTGLLLVWPLMTIFHSSSPPAPMAVMQVISSCGSVMEHDAVSTVNVASAAGA